MTKDQASQDPIRLELGATAEPRTCGSCYKFERAEAWSQPGGWCLMKLPPQYAKKINEFEEAQPHNYVSDTFSCDLYQHSGKAYIVSKLVKT